MEQKPGERRSSARITGLIRSERGRRDGRRRYPGVARWRCAPRMKREMCSPMSWFGIPADICGIKLKSRNSSWEERVEEGRDEEDSSGDAFGDGNGTDRSGRRCVRTVADRFL